MRMCSSKQLHFSSTMAAGTEEVGCVSELSVEDFNEYLKINKFPGSVLDNFLLNEISGSSFLLLEEAELKELVPVTGHRVQVRELLRSQKKKTVSLRLQGRDISSVNNLVVAK